MSLYFVTLCTTIDSVTRSRGLLRQFLAVRRETVVICCSFFFGWGVTKCNPCRGKVGRCQQFSIKLSLTLSSPNMCGYGNHSNKVKRVSVSMRVLRCPLKSPTCDITRVYNPSYLQYVRVLCLYNLSIHMVFQSSP